MKRAWWKLFIILIVGIMVCPGVNSFVFDEVKKNSVVQQSLIIPEYVTDWYIDNSSIQQDHESFSLDLRPNQSIVIKSHDLVQVNGNEKGPMDSAWPMFGHDVVHTCRSPYSTENNTGVEIWRVRGDETGSVWGSALIENNGLMYFGTMGADGSLYALYPNGTRKWRYTATDIIWGTPAISEEGIIYFTTWGRYFFAVNPDGTERWRFNTGSISTSSVTIGADGTLYFGDDDNIIWALNPDGTEKWRYTTGYNVNGAPAICIQDGTIYIGSGDNYLYALYPNGTLRWRFETGDHIKGSASIAPDGAIYVPSFDGCLYALHPNGTMRWKVSTGDSLAAAGVAIGKLGTIYVGTEMLRAYNLDGTLKWIIDVQGDIVGTVPAVSADGTIYVSAGNCLVAVNSDGTEKWRIVISDEQARSSPSIGPDDRVYVGSSYNEYGYLHAFGLGLLYAEAYGPYNGDVYEAIQFNGDAFGGTPPYQYHWDFGDGNTSEEQNPIHTYVNVGNYMAIFTVTDSDENASSDTAEVIVTAPKPMVTIIKPENGIYFKDNKILPFIKPLIIGPITIEVEASQIPLGIDRVEFFIDGTLKSTDNSAPYSWAWTAPVFFTHHIKVVAYDTLENSASDVITVKKFF